MRIQILIVLLACAASQVAGVAQEDESRSAALRGNILKRGLLAKGKTTTTTQAPEEEAEYEDEAEYPAEGESQEPSTEAPPSSTEGKKLIAGGVRPFRSNTDLLETLKRRRAQAAEAKLHGHQSTAAPVVQDSGPTEAPVKSSYSKKRFNNAPQKESNSESSSAPIKPIRMRFGKPAARTAPEPEPEEQNDAAPPAVRTGRAFARRN